MPNITIAFLLGVLVGFAIGILVHRHLIKQEKQISILALLLITMWFGFHLYGFYVDRSIPFMVDILGGTAIGQILGLKIPDYFITRVKGGKE